MIPLDKSLRNELERTVKAARDTAEAGARAALQQLGVGAAIAPEFLNDAERELRRKLRIHGRQLGDSRNGQDKTQAIELLTEEIAYEYWHRMLFARFLAENSLLMDDDPINPISLSLEDCEALAADEGARSKWELAARYASRMLPQIFRVDSPVFQLSLPPEHQLALETLLGELPQDVFLASDALGWVYQFWQAKKKDEVNESEVKIGARELPAVTQLFTEPYMVQFLLDNSLGAWWAGKRLSEEDLQSSESEEELRAKASIPGLSLSYLRFVKEDDKWRLAAGNYEHWAQELKDLKILDPCCGSGHFLVATLQMLVPIIVEAENCEPAVAIDQAFQRHLYGLELDPRCVEIAVFALALAAWTYPGANGYRVLPKMNIACCGLSVGAAKEEWTALANGNAALRQALTFLHDFYQDAPVLGSLLDPGESDLGNHLKLHHDEYSFSGLLTKVRSDEQQEAGLAAKGLLDATLILLNKYDLVITNVPYLARGKQDKTLQDFCALHYPAAKNDLATVFLDRCLKLCHEGGTASIVLPQNWLFLISYKKFREQLLKNDTWHMVARLGPGAFETISGEVVKAILLSISKGQRDRDLDIFDEDGFANDLSGLDVSEFRTAQEKGYRLIDAELKVVSQARQLKNPDARIVFDNKSIQHYLGDYSTSYKGLDTGDLVRFIFQFWETFPFDKWTYIQDVPLVTSFFDGMDKILYWESGQGILSAGVNSNIRGRSAWTKNGVNMGQMSALPCSLYYGNLYGVNSAAIIPNSLDDLIAIWCYSSSQSYNQEIRKVDQSLKVTTAALVKVPFDLEYWQKEAVENYPHGLPEPYSDDPTQWIFHGHPFGSVVWSEESKQLEIGKKRKDSTVLQIAIARLLGYRWPAELDPELELSEQSRAWVQEATRLNAFADSDGIVCLPSVRGEETAADRIIRLLAAAYGEQWSPAILDELLRSCAHAGKSLESWLRDQFFAQHCKLFQHRPFIWQIWDGLRDGFSVLINYHSFDNRKLQSLIYSYLGDWITREKHELASGVDGASEKLAAANKLKKSLEQILEGEAPYDIFVRWKSLEDQAIGWNPDLNDGVRMNIRPFVQAEVLRHYKKPILNLNWDKDRGKDVPSAPWYHLDKGDRINDRHLSLTEKKEAQNVKT